MALLALAVLLAPNVHTLAEGARYLAQWLAWDPKAGQRITPDGAFGLTHRLVEQDNAGRAQTIVARLRALGLEPVLIPVPGQPLPNILVTLGGDGPYTLLLAHYDKSREDGAYQGASDNTAAVAVLLAAAKRLAPRSDIRPTALLWTVAEEQGMLGARAFVAWAPVHGVEIAEAVNLDMLGRGKLAARPSGWPGLYAYLPGVGHLVYDGRSLARAQPYAPPDAALARRARAAADGELVVYRRFAAHVDALPLEEVGIPTLTLSSADMYYLDLVWERDSDRIELLDERHLESAAALLVRLVAP
jgi:Zn-dependent M28 family amino/carboxypeptidase